MIRILTSQSYRKSFKKFIQKHPDLVTKYKKTLFFLISNPQHPSLRLHKLSGEMHGLHSVSITMKYRITLEFEIHEDTITLITIRSHDDVY